MSLQTCQRTAADARFSLHHVSVFLVQLYLIGRLPSSLELLETRRLFVRLACDVWILTATAVEPERVLRFHGGRR